MAAFVKAERVVTEIGPYGSRTYGIRYFAMRLSERRGPAPRYELEEVRMTTLARNEYDEAREFETFEEAERVVNCYNDGPGIDVTHATWDYDACNWNIIEEVSYRGRGDREDFHADV